MIDTPILWAFVLPAVVTACSLSVTFDTHAFTLALFQSYRLHDGQAFGSRPSSDFQWYEHRRHFKSRIAMRTSEIFVASGSWW